MTKAKTTPEAINDEALDAVAGLRQGVQVGER